MADSKDSGSTKVGACMLLSQFVLNSILPLLFILGFSGMGFGLEVVSRSQKFEDDAIIIIESTLGLLITLFMFDSHFWPTPLRIIVWTSIFISVGVSLCLMSYDVPFGPICIMSILIPLTAMGIKNLYGERLSASSFVGMLHKVYVFESMVTLLAFFIWCCRKGHMWNPRTNAQYSHAASCVVDFTDMEYCKTPTSPGESNLIPCFFDATYENIHFSSSCPSKCLDVYQGCAEAFIIWSFPGLTAMALFVLGYLCKRLEVDDDDLAHHEIFGLAKFSGIFLFLFWIFASLSGAGEGLSSSLIAFAISMTIGSGLVFAIVFWRSLETMENEIVGGAAKQAAAYMDLLKGLLILGFSPLILVYLIASIFNQFIRYYFTRKCCKKRMSKEEYEHNGWFTLATSNQVKDFLLWDHSKILSYAVYWGIGYVFLNVLASKLTTVFLSWLIEYTSTKEIPTVTCIVIGVGMLLFLLPPIPGLPIYLTGGIVLVSVGRPTLGIWGSVGYACLVSFVLKLLACAVQQKVIGGTFADSVAVKQMVSINSDGIRAMRVMLSDKGITARKVAVLVGGPDWPVSVLCGILGLDLFPILIGTIPVVLLIIPTVFTGSFAFMGSLEGDDGVVLFPWADTMGAVASAGAAGVMFYFTIAAATAVKETLKEDQEKIDAIPIDEAVELADKEAEKKLAVYRRVTKWSSVPFIMKAVLFAAVLLMMGCCYILVLFNRLSFAEYDLLYTIDENLGGKWTNIVLPIGRIALLLFIISWMFLYMFESWATSKARATMEGMDKSELQALISTTVATYA